MTDGHLTDRNDATRFRILGMDRLQLLEIPREDDMKRFLTAALVATCGCGGALETEMPDDQGQDEAAATSASTDDLVSCRSIQWWYGYWITSNRHESYGWWDTDLAVH